MEITPITEWAVTWPNNRVRTRSRRTQSLYALNRARPAGTLGAGVSRIVECLSIDDNNPIIETPFTDWAALSRKGNGMGTAWVITWFGTAVHKSTHTSAALTLVLGISELLAIQVLLTQVITSFTSLAALCLHREWAVHSRACPPLTGYCAFPTQTQPAGIRHVCKLLPVSQLFTTIPATITSATAVLYNGVGTQDGDAGPALAGDGPVIADTGTALFRGVIETLHVFVRESSIQTLSWRGRTLGAALAG